MSFSQSTQCGSTIRNAPSATAKGASSETMVQVAWRQLGHSKVHQFTPKYTQSKPHDNVRDYSHSMASVLAFRHSSCTQFSVPPRAECRQVTPCRVSSASGTKAGTTLKTFFKLRALSFCFCPKGRGGAPLQAQYRRKRPFRNSTALLPASRQLQSQVNQRGRLSCWLKNRRSQLFVVRG